MRFLLLFFLIFTPTQAGDLYLQSDEIKFALFKAGESYKQRLAQQVSLFLEGKERESAEVLQVIEAFSKLELSALERVQATNTFS